MALIMRCEHSCCSQASQRSEYNCCMRTHCVYASLMAFWRLNILTGLCRTQNAAPAVSSAAAAARVYIYMYFGIFQFILRWNLHLPSLGCLVPDYIIMLGVRWFEMWKGGAARFEWVSWEHRIITLNIHTLVLLMAYIATLSAASPLWLAQEFDFQVLVVVLYAITIIG